MTVEEIAKGLVADCQKGDYEAPYGKYYSPNIVSIESTPGDFHECVGLEAVAKKGEWWMTTFEVLDAEADGPWINGNQFAVKFEMKVKHRESGQEMEIEEIALYTVEDGKIVREVFFAEPQ
ncbi:MAG TPA: nuclear transport factor 2 family protein [Fimbriimonadaceae bacterium]|nr:nuclear transport factor 2 family protein [Fimbriimonadaceae bacterium]HRJ32146.1 nuclear transport factor 2 family protein [Fimbriimonadaceae bacterium]